MKLKTYFLTLLLFLLFFNGSILLISYVNLNNNLSSIRERCLGEHYFIATAYAKDLKALENRGISSEKAAGSLFKSYYNYYAKENIFLEISKNNKSLYSNIPSRNKLFFKKENLSLGNRILSTIKSNGKEYICVVGNLPTPYNSYTLAYAYDSSEKIASCDTVTRILFSIGIVLSFLLAICLILLINYIFKPLKQISIASREIAKGKYENRIPVKGSDELSEMAQSFNHMADEIQNKVAQLIEAAEQKQCFIDNFAHELRTPLTTIYGYAEYIQKAAITEEEKYSATDYIMSESRRLQNMAYLLLDLALLRNNEIIFCNVSIPELFSNTIKELNLKAAEKQVILEYDYHFDTLMGNYELLECLLVNLVENSIKACSSYSTIKLQALCDENKKIIIVNDNGKGMNEEQLSHITEAFYRIDKSRSRAEGGAGLGLSLCKQIAIRHGAELSFSSQLDYGTTAKITFTTS